MGQSENEVNIVQRTTFFVGLLVLLALVGYLVFQLSKDNTGPPQLKISSQYQPGMSHYSFRVNVENKGKTTAEAAQIQMELYQEGESVATATLQFQYVPIDSREIGWVIFTEKRKPTDSLVVSSVSFIKP